jgi:3-oxoacyl-[acyl-carrier-protein] synthase II
VRDAFVRGAGAVTPLGADWPASWRALAEGKSAVGPVRGFDVTGFPSRVAAAIDDETIGWADQALAADARVDRRLGLARKAAREAWARAGVRAAPERTGVFVGAESGRASFATVLALGRAAGGGEAFDHARFGLEARALAAQLDASAVSPAAVAAVLARELGAAGPAVTVSLACSSGAAAIVEGARAVRLGAVDVAICGGVGADVDPLMLAGFGLLGALSARGISCPFDVRRDGFVVGEGAAFVVLSAERGEAKARVAGAARTLDAHHLTAPEPNGDGAFRAMTGALREAGTDRVGYVQAHGTSTPLNDAVEARAIARVLGDRLSEARVGSVKGALGHWVAGAGALGFLCALLAVEEGVLLPTAGLETADPECPLPHLRGAAERRPVEAALVNAFAFGGANSSLVVRSA